MAGFLKRLLNKEDPAKTDAARIYQAILRQARQPEFYGPARAADNYDGRIDVLTLHLSVVLHALNGFGEQGKRLSQALYETMREDFDIALREEGLSDTGVMKRIKPMIRLFYTRIKSYTDAFELKDRKSSLIAAFRSGLLQEADDNAFSEVLSEYVLQLRDSLEGKTIGQLALLDFDFPKFRF